MAGEHGKYRSRAVRFVATEDGSHVCDDDFGYDASLEITGDFATPQEKIAYAEGVAKALNAAGYDVPVWQRP